MKRKFRLTRSTDFQRVRRCGKSYAHPLVVLIALPSEQDALPPAGVRIGVAAGRGVGGAVQRNRAKRRLRAALASYLPRLAPGWDLVVLARLPILHAPFPQLQEALLELLCRAHLLGVPSHDC